MTPHFPRNNATDRELYYELTHSLQGLREGSADEIDPMHIHLLLARCEAFSEELEVLASGQLQRLQEESPEKS